MCTTKKSDPITHWTWEDNENETLCGLDVIHAPWVSKEVNCQPCIEVDEFVANWEAERGFSV